MIYITQLIYCIEGQERVFDEFEDIALPILLQYNGRLLFRLRPKADSFIELHIEQPYEIHFIEFDTEQDFENFKLDPGRQQFLHRKEQSVRTSMLIQGTRT